MRKIRRADFFLHVPPYGTYRIEDISCETYRAEGISRADGTKIRYSECKIISSHYTKKPRPLAEGVGEGSQHPSEEVRTQAKPMAKFNKDVINPQGGFLPFICAPRGATSFVRSTTSFARSATSCALCGARGVTEHTPSLHSGRGLLCPKIRSKLRIFEVRWRELKLAH